jgi:hypothetical protein
MKKFLMVVVLGVMVSCSASSMSGKVDIKIPLYERLGVTYEHNTKKLKSRGARGMYEQTFDGTVDRITLLNKYRSDSDKSHVVLHELIHWTKLHTRTNRFSLKLTSFEEEYVAEYGALKLGPLLGAETKGVRKVFFYLRDHPAHHKLSESRMRELDILVDESIDYIMNQLNGS